jgi:hypothetical protein
LQLKQLFCLQAYLKKVTANREVSKTAKIVFDISRRSSRFRFVVFACHTRHRVSCARRFLFVRAGKLTNLDVAFRVIGHHHRNIAFAWVFNSAGGTRCFSRQSIFYRFTILGNSSKSFRYHLCYQYFPRNYATRTGRIFP